MVNFGVKPLIAQYTFDEIPSPKKSGLAAEDQLTFLPASKEELSKET